MDEQTMKDYIEDLLRERAEMYERIDLQIATIRALDAECKRLEMELARHV